MYYTYDGVNNLLTLTNKKADHSIINSYQYTYDKNGNQLSKKEGTLINSYTYDALNRVSTETEANGTKTIYHYDSNGNILKKEIQHSATGQFLFKEEHIEKIMTGISLHIIEYTYDQANKLLSSLKTVDNTQETATTPENLYVGIMQIPASYTYDLHGNLIGEAKGGTHGIGVTADLEVSTYQYNEKNQLIESINKEGAVTTYGYNPRGLRNSKTTGGNTLGYYYDGANIIIETQNNNLLARNIRGLNLISREEGTTVGYYLFNGHGDVVKLVDNTGTDISNYDYEIYGVEKEATEGMIKNPFRYAGEYYDEETGFYYLRARYYHPEIARFVSEDTYKGELTDPLTLNYYIYCLGNPIRYVDPSGNSSIDTVLHMADYGSGGSIGDFGKVAGFPILYYLFSKGKGDKPSQDTHAEGESKGDTVKSNKGNAYDNKPSGNHSTTTKNPGYKGTPNSSVDILDDAGNVQTRRWFGPDGKAVRDIDYTNHGNSKTHPEWPHEHIWKYGPDGKPIGR